MHSVYRWLFAQATRTCSMYRRFSAKRTPI